MSGACFGISRQVRKKRRNIVGCERPVSKRVCSVCDTQARRADGILLERYLKQTQKQRKRKALNSKLRALDMKSRMRDAFAEPSYIATDPWAADHHDMCKVHAVHLCFGSSNCFRPSLTVVPSQDWEGSCLAKGAAAALQCALLFSCLRTSGAAALPFSHW